ncbi:GatB/YqeY domain-containing protein [Cytophagaceae bacterium DM2B3-1]|uniref:GatB/YqeY domain-containing protein n=1 Tax=Xanthocytophaga flava TaxID=3048013 RepID=A0AAE3UAW5_9BACT|nr:GatB/YqeY domain-containing protein [Xanthocytophaga flavus]MDJ1483768.1 GatB/YqeY domain-containing protein [Xanthocytophaga flavus]MDJ1494114.1 GatB/YqeY domain-containing protein [Xanthocytophaga flavus]
MSLKSQIDNDIKQAMLAKDKDALTALRSIKSLILLEETKEGTVGGDLKAEEELKLLTKAAKQRRESADIFKTQGREDLSSKELAELAIIERYLPKQLSSEELEAKVKDILTRVGAKGPADMGKVMGVATKELAGQADGKVVSETVKRLLVQ